MVNENEGRSCVECGQAGTHMLSCPRCGGLHHRKCTTDHRQNCMVFAHDDDDEFAARFDREVVPSAGFSITKGGW